MPTFTNTSTGRSGTIQTWTVPLTAGYRIEAQGAQGGTANGVAGGKGARIAGDFMLTEGEVIKILVGQQGIGGMNSQSNHYSGGGGGGTFVTRSPHNTVGSILVVAGGGGGGYYYSGTSSLGFDGLATANGGNGQGGVAGGVSGAYGDASNSGQSSGFASSAPSYGSTSYVSGGLGGLMQTSWGDYSLHGGFGGGGGAGLPSGGGGGYSGGGSGTWSTQGGAGGGGSYNSGTNVLNESGIRSGHGLVVITALNVLPDAPTITVSEGMEAVYPATANWTHVDSDGDPQEKYQIRWRNYIAPPPPPPLPSPLARYSLGESSGTVAVDSSGNGLDGTYVGGVTLGASGSPGGSGSAASFNGSTGYVDLPFILNPSLTSFSILCRANVRSMTATTQVICSQQSGSGTGRGLVNLSSTNGISSFLGGAQRASGVTMATNTWYRIAFIFDLAASTFLWIIDGVEQGSGPVTAESATGAWRLGAGNTGAAFLDGVLDDVEIYDVALSTAEVLAIQGGA